VNISEDDFDSGCDSAEMMSEYVLFHISCVIFLVSYLAPSCILWGKLSFHSGLTFGHFLMTILSLSLACASALFYWHSAFTLINVVQIVSLLYLAREQKFETDIEKIYIEFFHPFKISRREFSYLLSSNIANMVSLHPGECYAVAGLSRTDSLALLLTGKCSVLNSQTFLHNIEAGEFLDSPEFDSSSEARSFQVTVCAGVTSKYISWQRSKLEYLLNSRDLGR